MVTRDGGGRASDVVRRRDATTGHAPSSGPLGPGHTAEGVLVDSLHRMLGLPSPGEAPSLATLVLSVWLSEILRVAVDGRTVPWADAIDLHPGDPGIVRRRAVGRDARRGDTARASRRAGLGSHAAPSRTSERSVPRTCRALEARWMDDTMFGRWVVSSFPEPDVVVELLRETGSTETAEGIDAVRRGVLALLRDPAPGSRTGVTVG